MCYVISNNWRAFSIVFAKGSIVKDAGSIDQKSGSLFFGTVINRSEMWCWRQIGRHSDKHMKIETELYIGYYFWTKTCILDYAIEAHMLRMLD